MVTIFDKQTRKDIEFVIINTPPELMTFALKAALLYLLSPYLTSQLDLEETVDLAKTANKPLWLLASDIDVRTSLGKEFREDVLSKLGRTFKTAIHHKINIIDEALAIEAKEAYL